MSPLLVLVIVAVVAAVGWYVYADVRDLLASRRHYRALAERLTRLTSDDCPVCGRSRIFYRDGRRMMAPPHEHAKAWYDR